MQEELTLLIDKTIKIRFKFPNHHGFIIGTLIHARALNYFSILNADSFIKFSLEDISSINLSAAIPTIHINLG